MKTRLMIEIATSEDGEDLGTNIEHEGSSSNLLAFVTIARRLLDDYTRNLIDQHVTMESDGPIT